MILEAIFFLLNTTTQQQPAARVWNLSVFNEELIPFFQAVNTNNDSNTYTFADQLLYVSDAPTENVQSQLFFEAVITVSSLTTDVVYPEETTPIAAADILKRTLVLFFVAVLGNSGGNLEGCSLVEAFLDRDSRVTVAAIPILPFNLTNITSSNSNNGQCDLVSPYDTMYNSSNNASAFPINCIWGGKDRGCVCIPGFYMDYTSSQCTACEAGFYKPDYDDFFDNKHVTTTTTTQSQCYACDAGWSTLGLKGQQTCWACPPNTSTRGFTAQATCSVCGSLQLASSWGSSACLCITGIFFLLLLFLNLFFLLHICV